MIKFWKTHIECVDLLDAKIWAFYFVIWWRFTKGSVWKRVDQFFFKIFDDTQRIMALIILELLSSCCFDYPISFNKNFNLEYSLKACVIWFKICSKSAKKQSDPKRWKIERHVKKAKEKCIRIRGSHFNLSGKW
jgi:hypothetical protein